MDNLHHILDILKSKRWIDLSHNVNDRIPYFEAFQPIVEKELFSKEKEGFLAKQYTLVGQYGTHIDAPSHFSSQSLRYINDLDLKELAAPLSVLHLQDKVKNDANYAVSVADILAFEQQYGQIKAQSFVAFCSNWSKRWHDHTAFYNYDANNQSQTPGWSLAALEFLVNERDVLGIGHETLNTDSGLDLARNGWLVAEQYILDQNRYQIEVMNHLDQVPPSGSIIISLVPKIDNATGFPVRSMAIVEH